MEHTFSEALVFLSAPFAICLVLAGIHCYLGLHVLARGVIFVDLSLGQVAAFGASLALLLGFEHHSLPEYLISLLTTLVAAALFAYSRKHEKLVPQEALIGLVYALAAAAVVLVVDRMAHGAEHIKDMLVGQVLWVTWTDVVRTAAIYLAVSSVHYVFRRPLLRTSFGGEAGASHFWDFVFYALFGVVITSSVNVAGVLQVFTYLIVPALLSTFFFQSIRARLLFGWAIGFTVSFLALALSYLWDLPAGAFLVVLWAPVAVLSLLALRIKRALCR